MMKRNACVEKGTAAGVNSIPVTFGSGEVKLAGEVFSPNTGHPVPGVVLCHGFGSSRRSVESSARIMANSGVAALIFDFRGHGSSDGVLDGDIVADVVDAWHFLSEFPGVDESRVALVGHSMGAMAAILAARQVNPHALVALSCPPELAGRLTDTLSSALEDLIGKNAGVKEYPKDGALPWLKGPFAMLSCFWMRLAGYRIHVDWQAFFEITKKAKMSAALHEVENCPTLFVHCRGDSMTPYQAALKLYEEAGQPKDLLLVKGGFHSAPLMPGGLRRGWTKWAVAALMAN